MQRKVSLTGVMVNTIACEKDQDQKDTGLRGRNLAYSKCQSQASPDKQEGCKEKLKFFGRSLHLLVVSDQYWLIAG